MGKNKGCCGNCYYYVIGEAYCHLMDDLTEPEDNCGLFKESKLVIE